MMDQLKAEKEYREVRSFEVAMNQFIQAWYSMSENEYRRVNGNLPGSNRTSRLRKKRRKAVLDWFGNYIESFIGELRCQK